jgi:hypothetical protein
LEGPVQTSEGLVRLARAQQWLQVRCLPVF